MPRIIADHNRPLRAARSLVRSIVLPDELRRLAARSPSHPLVAAFQPLLAESESELEQKAGLSAADAWESLDPLDAWLAENGH